MSPWIEPAAAAIVALYLGAKLVAGRDARGFLTRFALLTAAAWLAENSVIEAYGFYQYSPGWSLFLHHVPLMIILIWPVVIHSAWDLARALLGDNHGAVPIAAASMVFLDAALIEPVAVRSGLWHWTEPGLFSVPPIGILGWAIFAGFAVACFQRRKHLAALVVAPIGSHLLLLACWWALFRWINHTVPEWPVVAMLWTATLTMAAVALRHRLAARVPQVDLWLRAPGAVYFFVLLGMYGASDPHLLAYVIAFAPPYLALARLPGRSATSGR